MRTRLDLEEAKLSIEVAIKQAINLYDRKGTYSVPYLRSIMQIAKEDLEKEFNSPVSEYSDWYIVKCKMADEEARQSEMDLRVFQITQNRKIIELFTEELKRRGELTMDEVDSSKLIHHIISNIIPKIVQKNTKRKLNNKAVTKILASDIEFTKS